MADDALTSRMIERLAADGSTFRSELLSLSFDSLLELPLAGLLSDPDLVPQIVAFLHEDNTRRMAEGYVVYALERFSARVAETQTRLRDPVPEDFEARISSLLAEAKGPKFSWLRGAIDPSDLRELLAPVVQQVLVQFTTKLPLPGLSGASSAASASAISGFVGLLGKQVQKSARDLADVGKSVMGGLSSELEKRMQALSRDFSQTAMTEFRRAFAQRVQSEEGKEILARMRRRAVTHVLDVQFKDVVSDLMTGPVDEIVDLVPQALGHVREQALFQAVLTGEVEALLASLGQRSVGELLREAELYEGTRQIALRIVDPGAASLFRSERFKDWLDRLLDASAQK